MKIFIRVDDGELCGWVVGGSEQWDAWSGVEG